MPAKRKRQRTTWRYTVGRKGVYIRAGWVFNPGGPPRGDVVRLQIRNSNTQTWDTLMTPLEAQSIAAALMLVVQHAGWTDDIEESGYHLEKEWEPNASEERSPA